MATLRDHALVVPDRKVPRAGHAGFVRAARRTSQCQFGRPRGSPLPLAGCARRPGIGARLRLALIRPAGFPASPILRSDSPDGVAAAFRACPRYMGRGLVLSPGDTFGDRRPHQGRHARLLVSCGLLDVGVDIIADRGVYPGYAHVRPLVVLVVDFFFVPVVGPCTWATACLRNRTICAFLDRSFSSAIRLMASSRSSGSAMENVFVVMVAV